jgi:type I restriction enzyme S subunit
VRALFGARPPALLEELTEVSWLLSPSGRRTIERTASSTSGLHTLSISKVAKLPIPIPPPAEAAEILRRISDALAAAAETQALLDAEAANAARLRQSILKAAFEGRLSVQDPADEPAHATLARLRTTETSAPRQRGRARGSRRATAARDEPRLVLGVPK